MHQAPAELQAQTQRSTSINISRLIFLPSRLPFGSAGTYVNDQLHMFHPTCQMVAT